MGHSAYGKMVLGIAVKEAELRTVVGQKIVCDYGHEGQDDWEHCPRCGKELERRDVRERTAGMTALLEHVGVENIWASNSSSGEGVLIHNCAESPVDGWTPPFPEELDGTFVVGVQVQTASSYPDEAPGRFAAVDLITLHALSDEVSKAVAVLLDDESHSRPVRLFLTVSDG